jgi:hypothetical protein
MEWVCPAYSRGKVDRAGKALITHPAVPAELEESLAIINNWRSSHSRPLYTFRLGLRRHAERVDPAALVAQRIKRMSSIALKLRLSSNMKLSQMQDIGGCRAVVGTPDQVRRLVKNYKGSEMKHKLIGEDDYINGPKKSGYRSHHLIYTYFSDKKTTHNGLRIEVQIRSQLQHAWATAVETAGIFMRQALKSSLGEEEWLRFFALMGTALSLREGTAPVPDTPHNRVKLKRELRHHCRDLDVTGRLRTYGATLKAVEDRVGKADYYLLQLDPSAMEIKIFGYAQTELDKASEDYLAIEKQIEQSDMEAVFVSVDSLASLRRAYPNYFLDTERFLEAVTQAIE